MKLMNLGLHGSQEYWQHVMNNMSMVALNRREFPPSQDNSLKALN